MSIRILFPLVALALIGCAAYMHGYTLERYTYRTLSPDSEDGAYRLKLESKVDLTIRKYLADHGPPDYFRVVDGNTVYFYYLGEDLVAEFVRSWYNMNSKVTPHRPIPAEQKSWLPAGALRESEETDHEVQTPLEECFASCRALTDRSKEECFDVCNK